MKICYRDEVIELRNNSIEELSETLVSVKVGRRSLLKLDLAIGYQALGGNSWLRTKYFIVELSPSVKSLMKRLPVIPKKERKLGILKELVKTHQRTSRSFTLDVYLILKRSDKKRIFEYVGCFLFRDAEIIDVIMAEASCYDMHKLQKRIDEKEWLKTFKSNPILA